MSNDTARERFNSRYVKKKFLGVYPPWQGFIVEDSLSDTKYFLFTLPPSYRSLSLDDLEMRNNLFSVENGMIAPVLSIQRLEDGISFLMPHATIVPITKALPSMKPNTALKHLIDLASAVLSHLRANLLYHNLTARSIVMIDSSLRILPTAYLLPAEMLAYVENNGAGHARSSSPLDNDLHNLGDIFEMFSRYLEADPAARSREFATRLQGLDTETDRETFFALMDELDSFLERGKKGTLPIIRPNRSSAYCWAPPYGRNTGSGNSS
jgi:hypothetical protein